MAKHVSASTIVASFAVGLVLIAFWPAVFGGESLVATDIVRDYAAPFDFYDHPENAPQSTEENVGSTSTEDPGALASPTVQPARSLRPSAEAELGALAPLSGQPAARPNAPSEAALQLAATMRNSRNLWPRYPTDPINIHAHWASLSDNVIAGNAGWWNPSLAGGQPTMKAGLPLFNLGYFIAPGWYAPGLVAALRTLAAIGLMFGFMRTLGLVRVAALVGGIAYGFSGFLVSWMNWPQSSVAALAPGLLWALEKMIRDPKLWRAVPIAGAIAAILWSNFPQITAYVLLAAAIYASFQVTAEFRTDKTTTKPTNQGAKFASLSRAWFQRIRPRGSANKFQLRKFVFGIAVAGGLALLLAAPHLLGFAQYLDWVDNSHRNWSGVDSSAGLKYLITAVAPALWGQVSFGPGFFGEINWVEVNAYVGASVAPLAILGVVMGWANGDRRRRSAVAAIALIGLLGVVIGFLGGPLGAVFRVLGGDLLGAMTRGKILWHFGVAAAAAFGVHHLVAKPANERTKPRISLGRGVAISGAMALVGLVAYSPFLFRWMDAARSFGALRAVIEASAIPIVCGILALAIVGLRLTKRVPAAALGWALAVVVGFELVSFTIPLLRTVPPEERLSATPAHLAVSDLLDPGERLAGEGWTFFPSTTAIFGIDDARGQLAKSPSYNALIKAVDPQALVPGNGRASPTWPYLSADANINSSIWDAMGVGVWALFPDTIPPGTIIPPSTLSNLTNFAALFFPADASRSTQVSLPEGGLRAVLLEIEASMKALMTVSIEANGSRVSETRLILPEEQTLHSFAFDGEDLPSGTPVLVEVSSPAPEGSLNVAVDETGELAVGMVAGDDDLRLVRTGDVILIERPNAAFVRLANNEVVVNNPQEAAQLVAERPSGETSVVLSKSLGLPSPAHVALEEGTGREGASVEFTPSQQAEVAEPGERPGNVGKVTIGRDRIEAEINTSREAAVVVSVANYPGWTARIDGEEVEIVTADAAFIAVKVPAGTHTLTLTFEPTHLRLGISLAAAGVLLSLALVVPAFRKRAHLRQRAHLR